MTDLSIDTILKHLPHRYPFLFIDKIVSIEKGKKNTCSEKCFN